MTINEIDAKISDTEHKLWTMVLNAKSVNLMGEGGYGAFYKALITSRDTFEKQRAGLIAEQVAA
ncbi:MAG: hypothetical protein LBG89_01380, partial [Rickettsiales bacterium]|nr:hypothetical protein [Rickettsiales bacterium]